ncbi:MAG: hypothetical protein LE180_01420 [Endomicrobium sp.]|uniref:hypothetical protein n=1 Tax=Candidatus Endomicrobiellum pyrsonymphae TaxID=1408203 RepID=UPI00357BC0CF|nr:hypothetical protein [Endomicrobium sp.]
MVKNIKDIAIVDASIELHMLDLLIYKIPAKINAKTGKNEYIINGLKMPSILQTDLKLVP